MKKPNLLSLYAILSITVAVFLAGFIAASPIETAGFNHHSASLSTPF